VLELSARLTIDAGQPFVRVHVTGENRARDHRLRLLLGTGVTGGRVVADAAFGPVQRDRIVATESALAMETPPPTAPMHRYVSVFAAGRGATVFGDGLAEYEAFADGTIALTLVRAVGELSRNDLPERPGHAGWPVPTPEAQSLGPFQASFAVMLHGPRTRPTIDAIERAADDVLLPLTGETVRDALAVPEPVEGIELRGEALAFSAAKESESGDWLVLRCVNLAETEALGHWRLGFPVSEARVARLDETPLDPISTDPDGVSFVAPPRAVVTLLVR
jgi:alpha-mannosidase